MGQDILHRRNDPLDPRRVGHLARLHRHVDIDTGQYDLACKIHVIECFPAHAILLSNVATLLASRTRKGSRQHAAAPSSWPKYSRRRRPTDHRAQTQGQAGLRFVPSVATRHDEASGASRGSRRAAPGSTPAGGETAYRCLPISTAVSSIRQEKPHSLSYQVRIRHMRPSRTLV